MLQQLDTFVGPEVNWFALSPMLTLLGGALVLMLAGALTPTWPKGLYAFATATIAGAAGVLAMVQWDDITDNGTDDARRRSDRVRHALDVPHDHDLHRRDPRVDDQRRVPARHPQRRPRDLRPVPGGGDRRHRDGVGQRPDRAVPGPRDPVARVVRARVEQPSQQRERRVGPQVLRARRVRLGVLPLRHRARLRRHRQHQHLRDGRCAPEWRRPVRQRVAGARRYRTADRRTRVQGGGGAVPRVGARRLSGRTDTCDRADGIGRQGRCVRRDAASAGDRTAVLPDDWRPIIWTLALSRCSSVRSSPSCRTT